MAVDTLLKEKIAEILHQGFPGETVDVSDGYKENIHIVVVSQKFTGLSEKEKQDMLWSIIDKSDLSDSEKVKISLILPYSPKELK
jgi:acid stress-induced BolA-like protein IbaG/YrbA